MYYQMSCGIVGHAIKYNKQNEKKHRMKEGHENCGVVRRWTYSIQIMDVMQ